MTEKEVKKLKRVELLELLIDTTAENDSLREKIAGLEAELAKRAVILEESGSIAEASIALSKVFAEAQDAADRYVESIRQKLADSEAEAAAKLKETENRCAQMLRETEESCAEEKRLMEEQKADLKLRVQLAEARLRQIAGEENRILHPEQIPEEAPPAEEEPARGWKNIFGKRR